MSRGKIEIMKIENPNNMSVSFFKRRKRIFKKIEQFSVLSGAQIFFITVSSTGKLYCYISPTTTAKEICDKYQKAKEIDLWHSQYQKMQEHLKNLRERNNMLRREIGGVQKEANAMLKKVKGLEHMQYNLRNEIAKAEEEFLSEVTVANPNSEYGVRHLYTFRPVNNGRPVEKCIWN